MFVQHENLICNRFTKRHQLSCARAASTFRKLPKDWRDKILKIIEYVENSQEWRCVGRNAVPSALDKCFANADYLPFYRDVPGMHLQTKQGMGSFNKKNFREQIGIGERRRTTLQCS